MSVVSFREYEPIRVLNSLASTDERVITISELEILDKLSARLGIKLVEHISRSMVRPRQYVGTIQMPTRVIEFLPKIEVTGGGDLPVVRHNMLEMLLVAYEIGGSSSGYAGLAIRNVGWLDLLILLFCRALADQIRRGLVKRYRLVEDDLGTVKGRILIEEQIQRNLVHRERTACEYDEFDEDHGLNQIFKLALRMMIRVASNSVTQQCVRELLPAFENVADVTFGPNLLDSVRLDRMSERFGFCLSLAKLFLQGMTTDIYSGNQQSFALMFDMAELFERYIGKLMRRALNPQGYEVMLQHSRHYLARDSKSNSRLFQLRPDIVVNAASSTSCIVDTKWKRLKPSERKLGVAQADLYQMLAYSERYQCKSILLLYPWDHGAAEYRGVHKRLVFEGKDSHVTIGEVSLADLSTVPAQLMELFSTCLNPAH
ncbi:McrC family protein [uncultured Deefgea sp.]|uniref:McrC family protein n=1 Tax=uncultured Deefgea sp. TaxID=1304914 RepID=UPI00259A12C1|nr:McrC family protein [uncultured Deefgea sp.]